MVLKNQDLLKKILILTVLTQWLHVLIIATLGGLLPAHKGNNHFCQEI